MSVGNSSFKYAQQGWQCPLCSTIYSPSTMACCKCTQPSTITTTDTITTNVRQVPKTESLEERFNEFNRALWIAPRQTLTSNNKV